MKTNKITLGTVLRFLSFILYEVGEGLQRAGDVLGDAGDLWDQVGPGIHKKAREGMAAAGMWVYIHAGAAVVFLACCLQGLFYGLWTVWNVIADTLPHVLRWCHKEAVKGKQVGMMCAAFLYRLADKTRLDMAGAWAFRAELLADSKGVA